MLYDCMTPFGSRALGAVGCRVVYPHSAHSFSSVCSLETETTYICRPFVMLSEFMCLAYSL